MSYLTILLSSEFAKSSFSCDNSALDDYLHKQASQDIKRKLAAVFIFPNEDLSVKGYYSLSNSSIPLELAPEDVRKKIPRSYHNLPVTLLGRLAVDRNFKGMGYGELLLLDALKRCYDISGSIGSIAVVVDPIDESAVKFYHKYGFIILPGSGKMFLPMSTIKRLLE